MSWFKKKKKEIELPKKIIEFGSMKEKELDLPDIPDRNLGKKRIPTYDGDLSKIKEAIDGSIPSFEGTNEFIPPTHLLIPKREPVISIKKQDPLVSNIPETVNKPIFVKLENYKEARDHLEKVRELAKDAEGLLKELNQTREEEDRELEKWKEELGKIKDSLLNIDKKLFEI